MQAYAGKSSKFFIFAIFQSMKVDIFRFIAASWDGGGIISSYRYMGERITAHLLIDESAAP